MTLSDILKSDFIEQTTGDLTFLEILLTLALAFAFGMCVFFVYKKTFQGVMYSKTFNIALVALSIISATIVIGVSNNIVLSLGMVGALSIVRFRTAIKDPMDVVYMFWSITTGIITGAGLYFLAIVSCIVTGAVLYAFSKVNIRYEPYLLVMNYPDDKTEDLVFQTLGQHIGTYKIKSKTKTSACYELTVEIRSKADQSKLVNILNAIDGVTNVAMVSYDGEYAA